MKSRSMTLHTTPRSHKPQHLPRLIIDERLDMLIKRPRDEKLRASMHDSLRTRSRMQQD